MLRASLLLLGTLLLFGPGCARKPKGVTSFPGAKRMVTPGIAAAVVAPHVEQADEVHLADDFPVVGVVVNGQARAYSIAALKPINSHVVNDLVGDVPVSVTYCDLARCLRVYTHQQRGQPIDLLPTGRTDEGLLLKYRGRMYVQVPGTLPGGGGEEPPLERVAFEETTWKAWRQKHPRTEVYTGGTTPPHVAPPNNA